MKKLLLILFALLSVQMYSQTAKIEVTGKVTDDFGNSLVGVTVTCESNSTFTDVNGAYKIYATSSKSKLVFTSIGLAAQTVVLGNKRTVDVVMADDTQKLDEVVVNIGYGTQKRANVTGSVSKIKSDKFENAPVIRLDQALQGKIAGVNIQNISSEAGSDAKIQVRGISSISADASPLIVVDGQPIPDGFASINSQDVESVEVLKDAASAAIYGSRGAGGVILITTKSGKSDKARYTFKNSIGFKEAYEIHPMLSSSQYVELLFKERDLKLLDPTVTNTSIANNQLAQYAIEQNFLGGQGTDYQKEVLRTALYRDLQFSVSGGNKDVRYFVSTGYQEDEGLMLKSKSERLNFRSRLDAKISKKLKLQVNLNPSHVKTEFPGPNYTDFYRFATFLPKVHNAATAAFVNQNPLYANIRPGDVAEGPHFYDLTYNGVGPDGVPFSVNTRPFNTNNVNPLGGLNNRDENRNQFRFQGGTNLNYQITKDLDFTTTANIYHRNSDRVNWAGTNATRFLSPNQAQYLNETYFDFLTENTLHYKKDFGNHNFDAIAGYTFQSTEEKFEQITATGFPTDQIRTLTNASAITLGFPFTFGEKSKIGLQSFLSRVNYNYKSKYLLSVSFRADGSSLFADGKRWGGFPAASVGWIVSKENFMVNVSQINKLGFRASYGVSGNNRIDPFRFQNLLGNAGYSLGNSTGANVIGQASTGNFSGNINTTWEKTFQTNFGLDLIAFNNRVSLTIDAYQSLTDKLLIRQPTQAFIGTQEFFTNIGSLKNRGLEVSLGVNLIKSKLIDWNINANISRVRNEIDNLGALDLIRNLGERNEIYQNRVGNPLVQFFGFQTDGVWTSQAEIDAAVAGGLTVSNVQNYLTPGGLKIVDINQDGRIDLDDRTVIGDPYPDFTWGFTNSLSVGNFNLSCTIQGVKGGSVYNGDANYNESRQRNTNFITNRWISAANPGDGKTPYETLGVQWMLTDYLIEDASYASLREVNLAYNFKKEALKNFGLSGLRFSVSGQNLYYVMADGYRGINPESRNTGGVYDNTLLDGYQRGGFPIPRTIIFGVEVNF